MRRRVCVTGVGVVSSIGIGKEDFWKNLIAGKSGISDISTFDTDTYDVHRGGEVKDFDPSKFVGQKRLKNIGRASQFAVAASKMALADASLEISHKERTGVIVGTTMADIQSLEQIDKYWLREGEGEIWPINVIKYPGSEISRHIGNCLDINGLNVVIPTACAAGNYSIGYAFDLLGEGKYDFMLAGGADPISRITFTGFNRLFAVAPEKCQPFDKDRKGMMIGEGAGMLVLEDLEFAKQRGAQIYAEVLGYGLSCNADHMTTPSINGIEKMMQKAIKNSGIRKEDVDYICAHGTGTPANDKAESEAIKTVFGEEIENISVSSIKSMLGHTMGAASAIEAIACCLTVKNAIIPPTINFERADPECDIDCVPNKAREKQVNVALNNSLAFGGNNACLAFKRYEE